MVSHVSAMTPTVIRAERGAPEPRLTPTEVSTWPGVPVKTLATWRGRGYGPRFLRCGVHVRYRASEVEKWLELQERHIASQST